ncbi:hypothetical protein MCOR27_003617 [Pyricularia oryzae]|uniref:Glutathione S-transferase n=5 Tax=Pyricularia TaxID=48558 RepID=A0ABQ8NTU7_PYRGI|nr:hypothetical protein MCOR01_006297 [Pyricularia oryzae]KAI6302064.1 hypothetical protein MCOR33_002523 [Pyricularia grisea]KAH9435628.1 hypothetical protein MCOR02_004549 [Pyricularia oryzae]KAI6259571.1 hypothetical protein MCOR19_004111 [Pyricularia oryzae]KAI6282675.1 hypothetical protein MCOR27_003617 [Pyricularia oryzae]
MWPSLTRQTICSRGSSRAWKQLVGALSSSQLAAARAHAIRPQTQTQIPYNSLLKTTTRAASTSQPVNMGIKTDIHLYTTGTPNGIKVSILLEELGLEYQVTKIDIMKNVQKEQWFLDINPNGRIPALTDTFTDGKTINLFESASIMQYLVDRYDTEHKVSYPHGSREHYQVQNWVYWQMGGLGPMQGQANHFSRYAPEKIQYGIDRYQNETRRLYGVMETQLASNPSGYLVGDKATIADFACWGWVAGYSWCGIDIEPFPHLKAWLWKLKERPGLDKGRNVPTPHTALDHVGKSQEELDKMAEESRKWIQAGMAADAKK